MIWEKGLRLRLTNLTTTVAATTATLGKACIIGHGKVGFEKPKGTF